MRLLYRIMLSVLCSMDLYASELIVTNFNVPFQENFNKFCGTLGTLPQGWFVSTNGLAILTTTNDFHGVHAGGVTPGGFYAWNLDGSGNADYALGVQPTTDLFTPGFLMTVASNATETAIKEISLSYEVVCLNNSDRSSTLDLEISLDGLAFVKVNELTFVSAQVRSSSPAWERSVRSCRMALSSPLKVGKCLWLRWYGDDAGGSGARDEYGIDNFRILFHHTAGTVILVH